MKPFYKTPGGIIVIGSVVFAVVMIYRTISGINKDVALVESSTNTFEQKRDSGLLILQRIKDSITAAKKANLIELVESISYDDSRLPVNVIASIDEVQSTIVAEQANGNKSADKALVKLKALKQKVYPMLRKRYAEQTSKLLWEHDIECEVVGKRSAEIVFVGAIFASNKNIKEYYTTLYDVLNQLRFKRADFKWYSMDDKYTYYTIDSPQDSE
ncbi:MAG: hypothetical protein EBR82_29350 [Caulobacteraceae bacterium]|nr:hypothetical protein [Caulobacteraceae bacterium]